MYSLYLRLGSDLLYGTVPGALSLDGKTFSSLYLYLAGKYETAMKISKVPAGPAQYKSGTV